MCAMRQTRDVLRVMIEITRSCVSRRIATSTETRHHRTSSRRAELPRYRAARSIEQRVTGTSIDETKGFNWCMSWPRAKNRVVACWERSTCAAHYYMANPTSNRPYASQSLRFEHRETLSNAGRTSGIRCCWAGVRSFRILTN